MNMKILIVDDFSPMRRIIKNLLLDIGYTDIYEAHDGNDACNQLKSLQLDFVITDWNMPNKSGLELIQHIRGDENLANLPVLMVTAESKREQIITAAKAGVDGYIVKPFNARALGEKIDQILSKRNAPA